MREIRLTVPEFIFVVGTRVALGAGVALLIAGRLTKGERRAAGLAATLIGAVTTIPAMMAVWPSAMPDDSPSPTDTKSPRRPVPRKSRRTKVAANSAIPSA
jgi:hypothetical protein